IKNYVDNQTQANVVPATIINTKAGNPDNGMVVKLGGKEWMAVSLTLADIGEKKDNVILTLYLANPQGNIAFNDINTSSGSVKGDNMYSSSGIRYNLLHDTNWQLFNQSGSNSFANQFLVQPKYISYQHNQSSYMRYNVAVNDTYRLPNESLDDNTDGIWHTNIGSYTKEYTRNDPVGVPQRYDAWGEDYIWIPSLTETGGTGYAVDQLYNNCIWKISNEQRKFDTTHTNNVWLRSGGYADHNVACILYGNNGVYDGNYINKVIGIRPAIHLNLTEAMASLTNLNDPQDLTSKFNEKEQTIKSIATDSKASWYQKNIYENNANYIKIIYQDSQNNLTDIKNVGTYWAKIEITESYINAINKQIDSDGVLNGWTEEYIALLKDKCKPKFRGDPDTLDSEHVESDTVRWIKITIEKAE
ncbi:MAG: hypothetical protein K2P12_01135, partial [Clostridia bacterium]|nr:hypothetical protein [Clostridia bacterium]